MIISFKKISDVSWMLRNTLAAKRRGAGGRPAMRLRGRAIDVTQPLVFGPREVMLTFDDGPRGAVTRSVLRTLDFFDVSAMFFLLGDRVDVEPDLPPEISARGHVVGSHTRSHPSMRSLSLYNARAQLLEGHAALTTVVPDAPRLFRFPYLETNDVLDAMVEAEGFRAFGCDVIAYDWECKRAKETLARALAALEETSSGIVLLHDIHRHTADALPMFLTALAERGYSVVTPVVGPRAVGAETAPGLASEPAG